MALVPFSMGGVRWGYAMNCKTQAIPFYNEAVLSYVKLRGDLIGNLEKVRQHAGLPPVDQARHNIL